MFAIRCIILHLIILNIVEKSEELVELPLVEDNDILITEAILRNTTNSLFSSLKFNKVKNQAKLKNYTLIHNYLVSLTLQDYSNLKEIARLTRIDNKNIDNRTENVMVVLNGILNDDRNSIEHKEPKINDVNEDIVQYVDDYMRTLRYLKSNYGAYSSKDVDINKEVLDILEKKALEQKYILDQRPNPLNQTDELQIKYNATNYEEENESNATSNEGGSILGRNDFWVPELSGRRIYMGKRTKIHKFPFMASVQIFNQFQCGSAIIRSDLVITAASCLQLAWNNRFYRENPAFLSVRVGSNFYAGGGENIGVLEVYFHPSYNPKNLRNNLAVMRLVRKINFPRRKKGKVKMIEIDRQDNPLPMNTDGITIVGWGARTRSNVVQNPFENRLSFAVLDVYPLEDCQDTYSEEYVTQNNFCAGFISKGSGACNHDVGGPGIVSGYLTGVVSFGSPVCGTPDAPTVFTKVGYYADWIEEIMEQEIFIPDNRKRTTRKPTTPHIFSLHTTRATKWILDPLFSGPTEAPQYVNPRQSLREITNVGLFKDFLKTMFDSKEIDEYIDLDSDDKGSVVRNAEIVGQRQQQLQQQQLLQQQLLQQQQLILQQQQMLQMQEQMVTEAVLRPQATEMGDVDPLNSVEEIKEEVKEHEKKYTIMYTSDHLSGKHKEDFNTEARKELERDIMKLIDNTDIKELVKEVIPKPKIAQTAKKKSQEDTDDNLLTLLYASDNDKDESDTKIFDKDNDGDDPGQSLSEGVGVPLADNKLHTKKDSDDDATGEDEGLSIITDGFRDFTYRNTFRSDDVTPSNVSGAILGDMFSNKVFLDILSEVIGDETQNKTFKA